MGQDVHMGFPHMWKTLWALITRPPDLATAVWLDVDVAMVHVALYMPLLLQLFSKQAGVGPNLFRLLLVHLLHAVIAVADVRGIPCKINTLSKSVVHLGCVFEAFNHFGPGSWITHLCRGLTTAATRGSCAYLQACTA